MKAPAAARERGASVSSVASTSSVLIRPTVDAIVLVLVLPLLLLIVVLVPWGDIDLSSPHLQLLGIALTFTSVFLCLKMVCAACPSGADAESWSRRSSHQGLLSGTEDRPPNYDSIMAANSHRNTLWVVTIEPAVCQLQMDPPPYHTVVIEAEDTSKNGS